MARMSVTPVEIKVRVVAAMMTTILQPVVMMTILKTRQLEQENQTKMTIRSLELPVTREMIRMSVTPEETKVKAVATTMTTILQKPVTTMMTIQKPVTTMTTTQKPVTMMTTTQKPVTTMTILQKPVTMMMTILQLVTTTTLQNLSLLRHKQKCVLQIQVQGSL